MPFSLIGGVLLIRHNQAIASRLAWPSGELPPLTEQLAGLPAPRVLIGGYGWSATPSRAAQPVGRFRRLRYRSGNGCSRRSDGHAALRRYC